MNAENIKENIAFWIIRFFQALDGKFGRRVLKPKYRRVWRWITWGTITILFIVFVLIPFMELLDKIARIINCIRWGC